MKHKITKSRELIEELAKELWSNHQWQGAAMTLSAPLKVIEEICGEKFNKEQIKSLKKDSVHFFIMTNYGDIFFKLIEDRK